MITNPKSKTFPRGKPQTRPSLLLSVPPPSIFFSLLSSIKHLNQQNPQHKEKEKKSFPSFQSHPSAPLSFTHSLSLILFQSLEENSRTWLLKRYRRESLKMISNFDVVKSGIDIWFQLHILRFFRGKIRVLHKYEISWIRVTMIEEFYIVFLNFSLHFDGIWPEKVGFLVWIRALRTQELLSLQRPVNQMAVNGQPDPSWPGCHMGRSGQPDQLW